LDDDVLIVGGELPSLSWAGCLGRVGLLDARHDRPAALPQRARERLGHDTSLEIVRHRKIRL
jgi:hypothetical protein